MKNGGRRKKTLNRRRQGKNAKSSSSSSCTSCRFRCRFLRRCEGGRKRHSADPRLVLPRAVALRGQRVRERELHHVRVGGRLRRRAPDGVKLDAAGSGGRRGPRRSFRDVPVEPAVPVGPVGRLPLRQQQHPDLPVADGRGGEAVAGHRRVAPGRRAEVARAEVEPGDLPRLVVDPAKGLDVGHRGGARHGPAAPEDQAPSDGGATQLRPRPEEAEAAEGRALDRGRDLLHRRPHDREGQRPVAPPGPRIPQRRPAPRDSTADGLDPVVGPADGEGAERGALRDELGADERVRKARGAGQQAAQPPHAVAVVIFSPVVSRDAHDEVGAGRGEVAAAQRVEQRSFGVGGDAEPRDVVDELLLEVGRRRALRVLPGELLGPDALRFGVVLDLDEVAGRLGEGDWGGGEEGEEEEREREREKEREKKERERVRVRKKKKRVREREEVIF